MTTDSTFSDKPDVRAALFDSGDDAAGQVSYELGVGDAYGARSPLWMVSQEPLLTDLVLYLDRVRQELVDHPDRPCELRFSRAHLKAVRAEFELMIRRGEQALHQLCGILCRSLVGSYRLQSVVIGEISATRERFTLSQAIRLEELYLTSDIDLGTRQLSKFRYLESDVLLQPVLVANMVEYQPTAQSPLGIHKVISRIKAEEELWNKVTDEIFCLDQLVRRDKKLLGMSHYVKDIFGLKIIVGSDEEVVALYEALLERRFPIDTLSEFGLPSNLATESLEWVETKNYLGAGDRKASGWEAIKSVVRWNGKMFELQIQPLQNFWREREILTQESHAGFKGRREQVREEVSRRIPLFGYFRELLWWLFHEVKGAGPKHDGVTVTITE